MNIKKILRILIILALLAACGWAAYTYGLPLLKRNGAPAPVAYQTARLRAAGDQAGITTSGAVRSNQTTLLAWQTSGTVSRVDVTTGQVVETKTVLAELEPASLPQAVILARAELVAAQKNLDTLLESTQARANAQMALVKAQQALDDAKDDRRSKLYQRASPETIDIARARLIQANDALDQAEDRFSSLAERSDHDSVYAAALSMLAKARQEQILAQYNLNYVTGLPDTLDIEEADAKITVAEANVLQAKLDWERVKDGPNPDDVAAAEARVTAAQATLNLARISAPFGGTLTQVNCKAGDQVTAGVPAFQLDDLSRLYLDVAVVEDEIRRVQVGQPVTIRLDALPGKDASGVVTEISAVGKPTAGTVNFAVTVEILDPGVEIRPGMTASVIISTGQASSALLAPARAIHSLGGQQVVYLLKDGQPAPVAVVTGEASGADIAITAGALRPGDLVVLNPEARASTALPVWTALPLPAGTATAEAGAEPVKAAVTSTPQPTLTPGPSAAEEDAVQAARSYFAALEGGNFQAAAELYSSFSLMMAGATRSEAALALQGEMARGTRWSGLEVKESRRFDNDTVLVHVKYSLERKETEAQKTTGAKATPTAGVAQSQQEALWPMRLENGRWLYNRDNLIDYRVLDVAEQAMGGLIVRPRQLARYSDHITLTMMVQNTTNEAIVLGQANEIMATFLFNGQKIEAVKKQMVFDRLRTKPDATISVQGLFETYPDGVIIRQWKNYNVKPWFTFEFTD